MIATPSEPLTIFTFASSLPALARPLALSSRDWQPVRWQLRDAPTVRDASLLACTTDDASLAAAHGTGLASIDVLDHFANSC